jgi:DNA repair photolyase
MDEIPFPLPAAARRGATGNASGRYEPTATVPADDGWAEALGAAWDDPDLPPLRTEVREERARSVLTRNTSPDVPFDRSINPYRGCEHGCIYCYARPTHAYLGLSPGLDFETRLTAKPDAPALLEAALRRPGYRVAPIAIGTNTDPYQPIERQRGIMRGILEVLAAYRHPVTITTKSALVLRDLDLLSAMAADGLAAVALSVTTLDRALARRLEPRASPPAARLKAVAALAAAGVPAAVMAAPVIPGLTDHELESILEAGAAAGAGAAGFILLRLPVDVGPLFRDWLAVHAPDRAARVESLLRQCRGGALSDARFGRRMRGEGPVAELLSHRHRLACRRLGLVDGRAGTLRSDLFRPPPRAGDQLSLW